MPPGVDSKGDGSAPGKEHADKDKGGNGQGNHDGGGQDNGTGQGGGQHEKHDGDKDKHQGQNGDAQGGAFVLVPFALLRSAVGWSRPVPPLRRRRRWLRLPGRAR